MYTKIILKSKSIGNTTIRSTFVFTKIDEDKTEAQQTSIDRVEIVKPDDVDVDLNITVDEIENRFSEVKSGMYHHGEGFHLHEIYEIAAKELVAEKLGRKWNVQ